MPPEAVGARSRRFDPGLAAFGAAVALVGLAGVAGAPDPDPAWVVVGLLGAGGITGLWTAVRSRG